ncbi:hypothetical protein IMSHALPRED_006311 [Imshaugia aleurites]|uniref:Ubiquitin carboxyl-terminal hydrolase n=1 Tax=Imshaugia aleurites TaxID=172621 RepID=A0A8H3IRL2_9LECA|nr:hypothetical protein IMSHALPRED_006311 [Imshaugia aleurites]
MAKRSTRRRVGSSSTISNATLSEKTFPRDPSAPATTEDKQNWKGFCEIESEPAFFNIMLKNFGVQGVKVQEIVSLDDELLTFLPRPVYGLIFLFKWIEEDSEKQEQSCPEGTINNACASVALLNIVNNVPSIDLGESLQGFKVFTANFTPALRGDAIGNFDFVKEVHNSFARQKTKTLSIGRKMDMLNADLLLKNEATAKKGKRRTADEGESEGGFHFIAFMPIDDQLWKLDGLERQPMCLGSVQGDWLSQAKPDIEARMARYEEGQIEFAILSLVRDPLLKMVPALARNVKAINALSTRLDIIKPGWRSYLDFSTNGENAGAGSLIDNPNLAYGLTQEMLDQVEPSQAVMDLCHGDVASDILGHREQLVATQVGLRMSIKDEIQSNQSDEERASARTCDYGARMQNFVRRVKKQSLQEA